MKARITWMSILLLGAVTVSSGQEYSKTFDRDKAGPPPLGWISNGEPWQVVEESQAPSPPHVLAPPKSVLTGGTLTRLLISSPTFLNGDIGVRFRITREEPPVIFGLIWSYADASNYEEVEVNTQGSAVSFISVREGKPHELINESLIFTPNTWHLIQVQAYPKQLTLYLDNEIILTKKTALRKITGQIGLSVVPNSPIQFDDFAWRLQ